MQFSQIVFVFEILRCQILGKISLSHIRNSFIEGEPIQFSNELFDVLSVEVARPINALFDFDDQREIVLFAFGNVAYQQIV